MTKYEVGRRLEYELKKELENKGWFVVRSAGSHSPFDLVAFNPKLGIIQFIQVKREETTGRLRVEFEKSIKQVENLKPYFEYPSNYYPLQVYVVFSLYAKDKYSSTWGIYSINPKEW